MLGIAMCFSGIGGMVLAPLFTFFINTFEWRMAYVISAIVLAVMVLPWTMFVLRFKPEDMGLKPYGWSEEAEREQALRNKKTSLASSSGVPASGKILLTVPFISMFLLCGLVSFYASVGTQMAPFGTELGLFGTPEANAMFGATIVSAVMIGNMGSKVIMGFVTDIIGVHRAMLIQLVLVVIGLLGFVFFSTSPWIIYVWAVLFGVQNSIYAVSTPLLIRSIFGEKNFTQIFTWARVGTGVIGAIGSTIIGYLFDIFHGYDAVFLVGVAIAVVCIACVVSAELTKKSLPWEEGTPVAPEGAD
jgi:MFS family permease